MGQVTDYTYFSTGRKKHIPGVSNTPVGHGETANDIVEDVIKEVERQLFTDCLNRSLYLELESALNDLPSAAQKWQDLVEGADYVKDGKTYRFEGLRGYEKDSLVAYYVFCEYMTNDDSYYSTSGTVKIKEGSAISYGTTRKYLNAWNTFVDYYQNDNSQDEQKYITDCYGCVIGVDYYKQDYSNSTVTLETYLKDHESDFEGYNFKRYERKNILGV